MGAELQLLRLIERDLPNKGIASYLGISEGEVSGRMLRLHQTLGLTRPDDNPRLATAAGSKTRH
jgi:DNA-binding NarL/FixJ family response regulator